MRIFRFLNWLVRPTIVFFLITNNKLVHPWLKILLLLAIIMNYSLPDLSAQTLDSFSVPYSIQQQLENITANNNDIEIQPDSWLEEMQPFRKHPLNINALTESDLNHLKILTSLQIHSFLSFRTLLGPFISIYELQAIPGWDVQLIQKIRPYISIEIKNPSEFKLRDVFKKGSGSLTVNAGEIIQRSRGYQQDSGTGNYYQGSPLGLHLKFKYGYKDIFQYGIVLQKDPGEPFFKGVQSRGFDFNSLHLFIKNKGIISAIAVGDYTVSLGQGLIQWQHGLAFKKGSEVLNTKRQEDVLSPYISSRGVNFHRGLGMTFELRNWQLSGFLSYRKLDGTLKVDTSINGEFISALQNSGFHRTKIEIANKGIEEQFTIGGNLKYSKRFFQVGVNAIRYQFSLPLNKGGQLYNRYAISGNKWSNYSTDYSYTYQNMHIFGELAIDYYYHSALVSGLMISMGKRADMSLLYRNISPHFQSLYGNAFTENSAPNNEKGFYAAISLLPVSVLKIEGFMDLYAFPWLKYRINAPSHGKEYLIQVTFKPDKLTEVHTQFQYAIKPLDDRVNSYPIDPVSFSKKSVWRIQTSLQVNSFFEIRSRIEVVWICKKPSALPENGFLSYVELLYKAKRKMVIDTRFQYFETDSYDSRIYVYERNLSTGSSTPVFYGKGYRYFINGNYHILKNGYLIAHYGFQLFPGQKTLGSGVDQIQGNFKSEATLQLSINI